MDPGRSVTPLSPVSAVLARKRTTKLTLCLAAPRILLPLNIADAATPLLPSYRELPLELPRTPSGS